MVDMREAFVKSLKALKSTPLKPSSDSNPIPVSGDRPTMVIPIGDLHVGKKVKRHNNLGSYDAEVAIERLRQVSELIKPGIYKENPERLVVVVIGDIFEALLANMRPGQQLEMDLMGQDQYIQLRDMFYEFLTGLAMQQIPTSVYFVAGNHDRLVAERTFNSEDILMHMFVDNIALNMQLVQKDFGLTTPFDVHLANRVQSLDLGHTELMFCHGHLSTVKNHDQVRRLIEVHSTTTKRKLIVQGHFHSYSAITGNNWRFVTLPSLCGSDEFARFNLNVSSPPEFMYFLCTKQHDIQVGPMTLI
jgi:predicted phosphodiesterase